MNYNLFSELSIAEIKALIVLLEKYKILTLTELHGFFTAILSSPILVKPSQWLPYVIQDENGEEYCFENEQDFQEFFTLILSFHNSIIAELNKDEPFKIPSFDNGKYKDIVKCSDLELEYWCSAYISGTYYSKWQSDEAVAMLVPFAVLAREFDIDKHKNEYKDIDFNTKFRAELSDCIYFLYEHNNNERLSNKSELKKINNMKSSLHKIGRNDICFCGSGKKFKKCCINSPTEYH